MNSMVLQCNITAVLAYSSFVFPVAKL